MTWPGSPKSASSPPINVPSTRFPNTLTENSTMRDVADAMRTAFNGLAVHEQAFANLPAQITTQVTAAATTVIQNSETVTSAGVSSFNSLTGAVLFFPGLGRVNNQLGQTSYSVAQLDGGAKIIVGDSSAVSIYLDSGISAPWFCVIDNDSSSTASLVAQTGTLYGAQQINSGGFGIVFFDGSSWWAGATGGASYVPQGGVTSNRPGSPTLYQVYLDTTTGLPMWWTGTQWVNAAGITDGATGTGPSEGGGGYVPLGGSTGSRPATPVLYSVYLDTTLGIPVWWNGTNWVNAGGVIS